MTPAICPKTLCPHLYQRSWNGGPLPSTQKRDVLRSPQSLSDPVFEATGTPSYCLSGSTGPLAEPTKTSTSPSGVPHGA